jgi:mannose-6-phosphate isomerase-like protein (cupin superfamily)
MTEGPRRDGSTTGGPLGDGPEWKIFELDKLIQKRRARPAPYLEFLRAPNLSCGIYELRAGATDLQAPHDEDEVYFVVGGRARLRVGDEERRVGPGSILFVRATSAHSFFEIEEDLTLLVFFASGGFSGAEIDDERP